VTGTNSKEDRIGEEFEIVDADGDVVDTASSGAVALKKKERIAEMFPSGKPYEVR